MEERPIIALVGRPNVGKSTLFNRLIGRREAITSHEPGTTRDRHFGVMRWYGNSWTVVDTAGVLLGEDETYDDAFTESKAALQDAMEDQVAIAVEEATIVALVVDTQDGLHPVDKRLMELLRKENKPVIVFANKADNASLRSQAETFASLGVKHVFPISAIHGSGIRDFVDFLLQDFPSPDASSENRLPRVTFIGRPNVGKSTLINRMLGEERLVVSATPGTTRDTISETITLPDGATFELVDTAGIRRRGQIAPGIERFSLFRTLRAINHSDIVVILLTIEEAPTRGDAHVVMYAQEAHKQVLLVLNKGDLADKNIFRMTDKERRILGQKFLKRFPFLQKEPFYFVSGLTGQGVKELMTDLSKLVSTPRPTVNDSVDPNSASNPDA